jgi:phosphoribosylformylglycinamidine cyclo-ligase
MTKFTYASSGVDVDVEEQAANLLYQAARQTWAHRRGLLGEVITPFDDFSGIRAIDVANLPDGTVMNIGFDGVGTKAMLAERLHKFDTVAFDLLAMVCDDAVVRGAEPVIMGSILDINTLGQGAQRLPLIEQLASGYVAAARDANVAIVNGEIAQLGEHVGTSEDFSFSWGSGLVWFAHEQRMFTGQEVKPSDTIVGLQEPGMRSNGYSLLRQILQATYGEDWLSVPFEGTTLGLAALHPSRIYARAVVEMFGGWSLETKPAAVLHGVAHITGSGLPGKLGRTLKPSGWGAVIDHPFDPCALMLHCQKLGQVTDHEAYRAWNMGQGMAVITPEPDKVMAVAKRHDIIAQVIGRVTEEPGIRIASRGYFAAKTPELSYE